jgi:hypothetical protein
LLDIAEFLDEVNLVGLLVVIKEAVDSRLDRVHSGGGCVFRGRGRHDKVDDVHGHGTIEPGLYHMRELTTFGIFHCLYIYTGITILIINGTILIINERSQY